MSMWEDVEAFHKKFGLLYEGKPRALPSDLQRFRNMFLDEEATEYRRAAFLAHDETTRSLDSRENAEYTHHLAEAIDGLVDLVYVALGTAQLHGFDFPAAWARVHEANMKKVNAQTAADSKRGYASDVVKPAGWQPPYHQDLVEDNNLMEVDHDRT